VMLSSSPSHLPDGRHRNTFTITILISWQVHFRSIPRDCVALPRKQVAATAFRPLLNKARACMETGNGAYEVHRPSWFAYETMAKFLSLSDEKYNEHKGVLYCYPLILHNYQYKTALTIL
jgi:hypothetical protein